MPLDFMASKFKYLFLFVEKSGGSGGGVFIALPRD